jgi:nitroreductase
MAGISRRIFLSITATAAAFTNRTARADSSPSLPEAAKSGGMSLLEALSLRQSTRRFTDKPIDDETLSTLLWCAFGINRPNSGGHTAPSWHGAMETIIYVADAAGLRKFDPSGQAAVTILSADIRGAISKEPFVETAPIVLVYSADRKRLHAADEDQESAFAHVDAGIVAQNVYLFCASAGLGTCLVGGLDKPTLGKMLGLPDTQFVTFVQPVGYPNSG